MKIRTAAALLAAPLVIAVAGVATAATGSDVQANNPQVQGDARSNTTAVFPTNKQNEPTIAVDPRNPSILLAGSNDEQRQPPCGPGPVRGATAAANDCSFFPGVGTNGLYRSTDGGRTWTNLGLLDDQASFRSSGVVTDGDPVIAFGPRPDGAGRFSWSNGVRAYYVSLGSVSSVKGQEQVIISSSDDDGLTWSAPVVATTKSSAVDFNDKNWIGVDTTPTSPYFGRVYVSWTEFRSNTSTGFGNAPVMVAASADGGRSFGAPNQLSPATNNGSNGGRQGTSIAVGPDGTVYVAFEQYTSQVVAVSRDGGASFTRPITIGPVADIDDPIPGANFRTDSFPVIAADPRAGSTTAYATWTTRTAAGGRLVVATSTDRGATWSAPLTLSTATQGYAFFPGLAVAPTGRVDIGFQGLVARDPSTFGTGNAAIDAYLVSKAPGGAWGSITKVSSASSDPTVSAQNNLQRQFWGDYAQVASTATSASYVFTDGRTGVGCPAVDAYQKALVAAGIVAQSDDDDLAVVRGAKTPGTSSGPTKPAPGTDCAPQFGNTDIYVATVAR